MGARQIATFALIAALGSGCGSIGVRLWPRRTVTEVVDLRSSVEIRSTPRGASVTAVDGSASGAAPYRVDVPYRMKVSYRRVSRWGLIVGSIAGIVGGLGFDVWAISSDTATGWKMVAGALLLTDGAVELAIARPIVDSMNRRALGDRTLVVEPRSVDLDVTWADFDPVRVTVTAPLDRVLVVRRPVTLDFEQGLIHWARTGDGELTGDALFAVGRAYAHRTARSADPGDRAHAIDYLERYLTSAPASASADEARSLLGELGR